MQDLVSLPQIPFDYLDNAVLPQLPFELVPQINTKLVQDGLLSAKGNQWKGFPREVTGASDDETKVYGILKRIFEGIAAAVQAAGIANQPNFNYIASPNRAPTSVRNNTTRPGGQLMDLTRPYAQTMNQGEAPSWEDLAVPFEFKKETSTDEIADVSSTSVWRLVCPFIICAAPLKILRARPSLRVRP
jgi:hypothetical protein